MKKQLIISKKYQLKYNYYALEDGNIYSETSGRNLSKHLDKDGYEKVRLVSLDGRHTYSVHRLILESFFPIENMENLQVNHLDGNKQNNSLSNLEWSTCQENINHACKNNLRHNQIGEYNNATKLTEENVKEIIEMLLSKQFTQKEIGKRFEVSEDVVGAIKNKRNWKHLTENINFN